MWIHHREGGVSGENMITYKGSIVPLLRHREYMVVFKRGNKAVRCFKYVNTAKGWRPSYIKDPINWIENCETVTVSREAYSKPFYLSRDYETITLWDAMVLLENYIKDENW